MHRLVIASVTLITLTGAAVVAAYLFLFSAATDRAAALAPASTTAYANLHLQPSTGQQMNLEALITRLPGFADEAALGDKIDQIVQNLLLGAGVDYRANVKPWLGDQVAVASWPSETDAALAETAVLASARDEEAATAALPALAGEGATTETHEGTQIHVGPSGATALVNGVVVAGSSADAVRAVISTAGGEPSLADEADFGAAMARLPSDHLAAIFLDTAAQAEAAGAGAELSGWEAASAALVAEPEGLRLSGSAPRTDAAAGSPEAVPAGSAAMGDVTSERATVTGWMPEDALASAVLFDLAGLFTEAEGSLGSVPGGDQVTSALDTFRALSALGLGLDLDNDILPLLGGEVGIALGGFAEGGLPSFQIIVRPPEDRDAGAILGQIVGSLETLAGADVSTTSAEGSDVTTVVMPDLPGVSYAVTDEVVVIGLDEGDVTAALAAEAGGGLAASEAYRSGFEIVGERSGTEVFVDVAAMEGTIGDALSLGQDARDILSGIGTLALTVPTRESGIELDAFLTVRDR